MSLHQKQFCPLKEISKRGACNRHCTVPSGDSNNVPPAHYHTHTSRPVGKILCRRCTIYTTALYFLPYFLQNGEVQLYFCPIASLATHLTMGLMSLALRQGIDQIGRLPNWTAHKARSIMASSDRMLFAGVVDSSFQPIIHGRNLSHVVQKCPFFCQNVCHCL